MTNLCNKQASTKKNQKKMYKQITEPKGGGGGFEPPPPPTTLALHMCLRRSRNSHVGPVIATYIP